MKVLIVLPARSVLEESFLRFVKSIEQNLGATELELSYRDEIELPKSARAYHVAKYNQFLHESYDAIAFVEESGEFEESTRLASIRKNVYRFDQTIPAFEPRMLPVDRQPDIDDYPFADAHIFNTLTPQLNDQFYFFPYGYLFRYVGFGPINAFGHRIPQDLNNYKDRSPEHKLIVFFGGSACFSMYCLHDEMFSSKLEELLNQGPLSQNGKMRFTVLNFGQHGNVVLNQTLTYLLFVQQLKPDIVISHDGFNDVVYGQIADPALIGENEICYQNNLESWSTILHDSEDAVPAKLEINGVRQVLNTPSAVISAYFHRKKQFDELVCRDGGLFVWGLQPFLLSKAKLNSEEEAHRKNSLDVQHQQIEGYRNVSRFYELIGSEMKNAADHYCNIHNTFSKYGDESTLFYDFVHCSPKGDEYIANAYYDYLSSILEIV